MLWGRSAARVQRVQKVHRVQRGVVAAGAAGFEKKGRKGARLRCGLCRRVVYRFAQGAEKRVLKMDGPSPKGS